MPSGAKKRVFAEDQFDLDQFRQAQQKKTWLAEYNRRNKKMVNMLTLVIVAVTAGVGYFIFVILQYYINLWR